MSRAVEACRAAHVRPYSAAAQSNCWSCHEPLQSLFFGPCGAVQPPDPALSYFQLLGLPVCFTLDAAMLHDIYRDLQRQLHPDKFAQKSEKERTYSEQQSVLVNKAYSTLSRPIKRGVYMLSLHGESIEEDTVGAAGGVEDNFLMQVMELNEDIEEITQQEDSVKERLEEVSEENETALEELYARVTECFDAGNIAQAKLHLIKAKYYVSAQDRIKEIINNRM